ncbi:hypothetical protein KVMX100_80081 [Klebsiella variicola]|nr:hypothetical protein KVMX100_80081 [Klebsiella variicola]
MNYLVSNTSRMESSKTLTIHSECMVTKNSLNHGLFSVKFLKIDFHFASPPGGRYRGDH